MLLTLMAGAAIAAGQPVPAPVAPEPGDMMVVDVPDDFTVGYQARAQGMAIMEFIRPPEAVETWRDAMVSTFVFYGGGGRDPSGVLSAWKTSVLQSCPGSTATPETRGAVDGQTAVMVDIDCPLNAQSSTPENVIGIAIQGKRNLLMTQIAFRHPRTDADRTLVKHVLDSLKMCDEGAMLACEARKPRGFVAARP